MPPLRFDVENNGIRYNDSLYPDVVDRLTRHASKEEVAAELLPDTDGLQRAAEFANPKPDEDVLELGEIGPVGGISLVILQSEGGEVYDPGRFYFATCNQHHLGVIKASASPTTSPLFRAALTLE